VEYKKGEAMIAKLTQSGCTLTREDGDKLISHESTVGYKMERTLNAQGYNFVRLNPSKHGLTSCRLGLIDHKAGIALWHERYQIENAATEFNHGRVFFMRTEASNAN
jgi:hypothetical protein